MKQIRRRIRSAALLTVTALALTLGAPAFASDDRAAEPDNFGTALRYAGCALTIASATGGLGIAAAVIGCFVLLADDTK
jgi:hypothetical protein